MQTDALLAVCAATLFLGRGGGSSQGEPAGASRRHDMTMSTMRCDMTCQMQNEILKESDHTRPPG